MVLCKICKKWPWRRKNRTRACVRSLWSRWQILSVYFSEFLQKNSTPLSQSRCFERWPFFEMPSLVRHSSVIAYSLVRFLIKPALVSAPDIGAGELISFYQIKTRAAPKRVRANRVFLGPLRTFRFCFLSSLLLMTRSAQSFLSAYSPPRLLAESLCCRLALMLATESFSFARVPTHFDRPLRPRTSINYAKTKTTAYVPTGRSSVILLPLLENRQTDTD